MLSRNTLPLHQFIAQSMNRGTAHPVQVLNCFWFQALKDFWVTC